MYNYASATVVYGMLKRIAECGIRLASNNAETNFCGNLIFDGTKNY